MLRSSRTAVQRRVRPSAVASLLPSCQPRRQCLDDWMGFCFFWTVGYRVFGMDGFCGDELKLGMGQLPKRAENKPNPPCTSVLVSIENFRWKHELRRQFELWSTYAKPDLVTETTLRLQTNFNKVCTYHQVINIKNKQEIYHLQSHLINKRKLLLQHKENRGLNTRRWKFSVQG